MANTINTTREYQLRWWTLGVVAISVINVMFDTTIVNIALPTFQRELLTTQSELQWIVNSTMIILGSLMLITGPLADRWGRARMLQTGLIAYAAASVAAAFAASGGQLIFWRAIMGVGSAMVLPATLAIITDVFPREEQGKAIGIWAGVNAIGIAVGPILAGLIIENLHWGWVFLINVPLAIVAVIGGFFVVPNSRNPNPKRLDLLGAVLSTGGLALLIYGLIESGRLGWNTFEVVGPLAGAAVLLALFYAWERRTAHPLVEIGFFRKARFSAGIAALCLMALAMMGINFVLTLYMQFVRFHSPLETGVRFIPIALGLFIGAGVADKVVAKIGTTKVLVIGFLGIAAVSALAGFAAVDTPYWQLGLIIFGWGLFLGYVAAAATDAVMGSLPAANAGVGSAMNIVARMIAGAMGIAVLVSVLSSVYTASFRDAATALSGIPPEGLVIAGESVGAAVVIAQQLPPDVGAALIGVATASFMDGWQVMAFIVAGISLIGSVVAAATMPARDEVAQTDRLAMEHA